LGGSSETDTRGARNEWAADEELRIISISADLAELLGVQADEVAGQPLTRVVRLEEDDAGEMPLISALAARRGFSGQRARSRVNDAQTVILSGDVVTGADGVFAGFRGLIEADGVIAAPVSPPSTRSCVRRSTGSSRAPSGSWSAPMGRCAAITRATETISQPPRVTCSRC
jgi:hypothetical protein